MKALAEQIGDIDGVNIYGRVVGVRGLMVEIAGPIHAMSVGARIVIETGGNRFIPSEVIGFSGNNAVVMPFAGLEGVRRGCRAVIANAASQVRPSAVLARPRHQRDGRADRRQGAAAAGAVADAVPQLAAAGAFAQARRRAARSRRARAQYLPDLLPRPAARHLRRLRRRQVGAAVDAGAQCRCRHHGDRPGRRTRPRGAGIPAGRPRRGGSGALGGGGGDLGRARPDAAAGGLSDAGDRGIFPRRGQGRAVPDGFGDALCDGAARDRPVGRRAADRQGLYADRVHRIAEAAGARRARAPAPAPSPASSRCWWMATTTTSRSRTRCAASSTAIS